MPYCPKCGKEVGEDMVFCPNCGASMKAGQVASARSRPVEYRHEKDEREKQEKREKEEKAEKHEKREQMLIGPLIGGLVLILLGTLYFLEVTGAGLPKGTLAAFVLITVGAVIIVGAAYGAMLARRRNPRT